MAAGEHGGVLDEGVRPFVQDPADGGMMARLPKGESYAMDPDAMLDGINEISRNTTDVPHVGNALRELAHKFNQLNDWLTMGGELPRQWRDRGVTRHDQD